MSWLNICVYPDPVLKEESKKIDNIDDKIRKFVKDMINTMYATPGGIGLAAPQVGVNSRLVVLDRSLGKTQDTLVMINPKIISAEGEVVGDEGCLSLPEAYGQVKRPKRVEVEFVDLKEKTRRIIGEGYIARVFHHEVDHLDGVLFIDRMSRLRRDFVKMRYLKRMKKQKRCL